MKNKKINYSERPWGRYFIIEDNNNYKIKRIEGKSKKQTILSISYAEV